MRFLVDNQLPVALARYLTSRGMESLHVLDVGLAQASDSGIWQHASAGAWVVVSKDEDFLHRAARPGSSPFSWFGSGWATAARAHSWMPSSARGPASAHVWKRASESWRSASPALRSEPLRAGGSPPGDARNPRVRSVRSFATSEEFEIAGPLGHFRPLWKQSRPGRYCAAGKQQYGKSQGA